MNDSRVQKSIKNARVGLLFYFLGLILSFFSRKIFLDSLGASFIGLTGTLGNILGFLNLAELGIGGAIGYFLFAPLQSDNKEKIMEIMSVFGYLYRIIGIVIGLGGILISLFFPLIFAKTDFNMGIIYFAFFSYLGSSLIGYFINYRQILLTADQKNYVVTAYFQTSGLIKTVIQIALAYYYKNLYVWVAIEFLFGIVCCIILNWKINKEYPWLRTNISQGKILLKKYPEILTNTRQIFVHKIKDFILGKSDEILIFAFVSLKMVAYYGNYIMIISKLSLLFLIPLDGVHAGVGNLVAEGNKKNMMKVFWELMSIRYFIAGVLVFSLYHLVDPFISWWLGNEYLLSKSIVILLLINLYIMQTRGVIDMFNHAHGLYADTWSAWAEGILNISITIAAGLHYGIIGILLGKIISTLFIVVLWKPYYLFSKGLKLSIATYWKGSIKYHLSFILNFILFTYLSHFLPFDPGKSLPQLILYAICSVIPFFLFFLLTFYFFTPGMKSLMKRLPILKNIL